MITIDNTLTGANVGGGVGVFSAKSGAALQFNTLAAGLGIAIALASNLITISTDEGTVPATVNLYVSAAGSDVTGNGTAGNPYQTIQRAYQDIREGGYNTSATVTILSAGGSLPLGPGTINLNHGTRGRQASPVVITGDTSTVYAARTVASTVINPGSQLVTINFVGAFSRPAGPQDFYITFTSGALSGQSVYLADTPGPTSIVIPLSASVPAAGVAFQILSVNTNISVAAGTTVIEGGGDAVVFQNLRFVLNGAASLLFQTVDAYLSGASFQVAAGGTAAIKGGPGAGAALLANGQLPNAASGFTPTIWGTYFDSSAAGASLTIGDNTPALRMSFVNSVFQGVAAASNVTVQGPIDALSQCYFIRIAQLVLRVGQTGGPNVAVLTATNLWFTICDPPVSTGTERAGGIIEVGNGAALSVDFVQVDGGGTHYAVKATNGGFISLGSANVILTNWQDAGILVERGGFVKSNGPTFGNSNRGQAIYVTDGGGFVDVSAGLTVGDSGEDEGVLIENGSMFRAAALTSTNNAANGLTVTGGSMVSIDVLTCTGNTESGVYVQDSTLVVATSLTASGNAISSMVPISFPSVYGIVLLGSRLSVGGNVTVVGSNGGGLAAIRSAISVGVCTGVVLSTLNLSGNCQSNLYSGLSNLYLESSRLDLIGNLTASLAGNAGGGVSGRGVTATGSTITVGTLGTQTPTVDCHGNAGNGLTAAGTLIELQHAAFTADSNVASLGPAEGVLLTNGSVFGMDSGASFSASSNHGAGVTVSQSTFNLQVGTYATSSNSGFGTSVNQSVFAVSAFTSYTTSSNSSNGTDIEQSVFSVLTNAFTTSSNAGSGITTSQSTVSIVADSSQMNPAPSTTGTLAAAGNVTTGITISQSVFTVRTAGGSGIVLSGTSGGNGLSVTDGSVFSALSALSATGNSADGVFIGSGSSALVDGALTCSTNLERGMTVEMGSVMAIATSGPTFSGNTLAGLYIQEASVMVETDLTTTGNAISAGALTFPEMYGVVLVGGRLNVGGSVSITAENGGGLVAIRSAISAGSTSASISTFAVTGNDQNDLYPGEANLNLVGSRLDLIGNLTCTGCGQGGSGLVAAGSVVTVNGSPNEATLPVVDCSSNTGSGITATGSMFEIGAIDSFVSSSNGGYGMSFSAGSQLGIAGLTASVGSGFDASGNLGLSGLIVQASTVSLVGVASFTTLTNGQSGIIATASTVMITASTSILSTHNGQYNLAVLGGRFSTDNSFTSQHAGLHGVYIDLAATVNIGGLSTTNNTQRGLYIASGSTASVGALTVNNNQQAGVFAQDSTLVTGTVNASTNALSGALTFPETYGVTLIGSRLNINSSTGIAVTASRGGGLAMIRSAASIGAAGALSSIAFSGNVTAAAYAGTAVIYLDASRLDLVGNLTSASASNGGHGLVAVGSAITVNGVSGVGTLPTVDCHGNAGNGIDATGTTFQVGPAVSFLAGTNGGFGASFIAGSRLAIASLTTSFDASTNGVTGLIATSSIIEIDSAATFTTNSNTASGIALDSSTATIYSTAALTSTGNGAYNIQITSSYLVANDITASSSTGVHGLKASSGSLVRGGNLVANSNALVGMYLYGGAVAEFTTVTCNLNQEAGVYVELSSLTVEFTLTASQNAQAGVALAFPFSANIALLKSRLSVGGGITATNGNGGGLTAIGSQIAAGATTVGLTTVALDGAGQSALYPSSSCLLLYGSVLSIVGNLSCTAALHSGSGYSGYGSTVIVTDSPAVVASPSVQFGNTGVGNAGAGVTAKCCTYIQTAGTFVAKANTTYGVTSTGSAFIFSDGVTSIDTSSNVGTLGMAIQGGSHFATYTATVTSSSNGTTGILVEASTFEADHSSITASSNPSGGITVQQSRFMANNIVASSSSGGYGMNVTGSIVVVQNSCTFNNNHTFGLSALGSRIEMTTGSLTATGNQTFGLTLSATQLIIAVTLTVNSTSAGPGVSLINGSTLLLSGGTATSSTNNQEGFFIMDSQFIASAVTASNAATNNDVTVTRGVFMAESTFTSVGIVGKTTGGLIATMSRIYLAGPINMSNHNQNINISQGCLLSIQTASGTITGSSGTNITIANSRADISGTPLNITNAGGHNLVLAFSASANLTNLNLSGATQNGLLISYGTRCYCNTITSSVNNGANGLGCLYNSAVTYAVGSMTVNGAGGAVGVGNNGPWTWANLDTQQAQYSTDSLIGMVATSTPQYCYVYAHP